MLDLEAAFAPPDIKDESRPPNKLFRPNSWFFDLPYSDPKNSPTQILRSRTIPNLVTHQAQNTSSDKQHAPADATQERAVESSNESKAEVPDGPYVIKRYQVREYYVAIAAGLYPIPRQCREYYQMDMFEFRRKGTVLRKRQLVWEPWYKQREIVWKSDEERVRNAKRPKPRAMKYNFPIALPPAPGDPPGEPAPAAKQAEPAPTTRQAELVQAARRANVVSRPVLARARRRTRFSTSGTRLA